MDADLQRITLAVSVEDDADAEEIDELTRRLGERLLETDVEAVEAAGDDPAPDDTRSAEAITVGVLSVLLAPGVIKALFGTVQTWLAVHNQVTRVRITINRDAIDLTNPTSAEKQQLIDHFIARTSKK